ncbi:hypothetical protein LCGC14_1952680 [marine sediment metagenome]|uniref:Uncharacterized protein n=1 Tax=marine sediment metagenome TaxID=412755 RepID=A0A0F9IE15_9ZZZZ
MELKEALANLDQICAEFKGTRTDHVALQQSMQVVTAAVTTPLEEEKEDPKKEPDGNTK